MVPARLNTAVMIEIETGTGDLKAYDLGAGTIVPGEHQTLQLEGY